MTSEPRIRPPNRWVLLRWDLLVFALAAVGFVVNWLRPYELSSTMLVVFGAAMLWVGYRMYLKLQAYHRAE